MPPPRRWRCTYTKDTHKRTKNARWVDGVLEVSTADERVARLFAADDNDTDKPTGDVLASRKLTGSEFDALEDGDSLKGLGGHDVHPDDEIGGDGGGAKLPTSGAFADVHPVAPRSTTTYNPQTATAVRRAFKAPAMVAPRGKQSVNNANCPQDNYGRIYTHTTKRKSSELELSDSDDVDPSEVLKKFVSAKSGFDDLYQIEGGMGKQSDTPTHQISKPVIPLAKRQSKWAAFDNSTDGKRDGVQAMEMDTGPVDLTEREPSTTTANPFSSGGSSGGVSDLAAALARAGTTGVEGLASLVHYTDTEVTITGEVKSPSVIAPPVARRVPGCGARKPATWEPPTRATPVSALSASGVGSGLGSLTFPSTSSDVDTNQRTVQHLSSFPTPEAYKTYFCSLLELELFDKLKRARAELEQCTREPMSKQSDDAAAQRISKQFRQSRNSQSAYHAECVVRFESYFGSGGGKGGWKGNKNWKGKGKRSVGEEEDDGDADTPSASTGPKTKSYLYLQNVDERKGMRRYSKGDLWVLSNSPRFFSSSRQTVGDRTKAPFSVLAKSLWHGPDKDGKLEITLLSATRPAQLKRDKHAYPVYGLRVGGTIEVFAQHDAFASMDATSFPLLPHVCGGSLVSKTVDLESTVGLNILSTTAKLQEKFNLNKDQASAVAFAVQAGEEASNELPLDLLTVSPVRLIHGPFGSGKTKALAAFITAMAERLDALETCENDDTSMSKQSAMTSKKQKTKSARILVTAHTNVAVDKVLTALLELGFSDFVRVGRLRAIDPRILPHSLHVAGTSGSNSDSSEQVLGKTGRPLRGKGLDHARELRAMLRDAATASEKAVLTKELAETQAGKADARARMLGKCRVVGTTTASCSNDSLSDSMFQIVVMDEASQMTEPSSMLAVSKFGARTVVAVGDPKQLPPVVEGMGNYPTSYPQGSANSKSKTQNSLHECLFTRLQNAEHVPTLLRTQYRLHPNLSKIPNASFYDGQLLDGCSTIDRQHLLLARDDGQGSKTPMPPLTWMDLCLNDIQHDYGRSAFSKREAKLAALIVGRVMSLGIAPEQIGVISLFKAQSQLIQQEISEHCLRESQRNDCDESDVIHDSPSVSSHLIQVSTVDAFQGQEKEVLVLSLCGGGGAGFLTDERLNVALTRAKRHLIILGDSKDGHVRNREAWRMCLAQARKAPGGFTGPGQTANESAMRLKLSEWRAAGASRQVTAVSVEAMNDEDSDDVVFNPNDSKSALNTTMVELLCVPEDDEDDDDEKHGDDVDALSTPSAKVSAVTNPGKAKRPSVPPPELNSPDTYDFVDPDDPTGAELLEPIVLSGDPDALYVKSPMKKKILTPIKSAKKRKPLLKINQTNESPLKKETPKETAEEQGKLPDSDILQVLSQPLVDLESLPPARLLFHAALKEIGFDQKIYWQSYKDVHKACLYGDKKARERIEYSKLGALLATHFHFQTPFPWTKDVTRRTVTSDVLPGMSTFIHSEFGFQWTRLSKLIVEFDDVDELSKDKGFGVHVIADAETQEFDEKGAEAFAKGGDASKAFA